MSEDYQDTLSTLSREDSYYTDTDSVVLGQPLPKEEISSSVLGKFKLEDTIKKGDFLAPKSYFYITIEDTNVIKFKGPTKDQVNPEWFESQYADPSRTKLVSVESNFRIDWHTLNVIKKDTLVRFGIKQGSKRIPVYDKDDLWVDTDPIDIKDMSFLKHIGKQIIKSLRNNIVQLQIDNQILNKELSKKEKDIAERYKEIQSDVKKNTDKSTQSTAEIETEDRTLLDKEDEPTENPTFDDSS